MKKKRRRVSIRSVHRFIRKDLPRRILRRYKQHAIFSEADLQSYVWRMLAAFMRRDRRKNHYKVLNKPFLRRAHAYPDIVVFKSYKKRNVPWVVLELKEVKKLKLAIAKRERSQLHKYRRLGCRRTYLFYVARTGPSKVFKTRRRKDRRYFYEVPIILDISIPRLKSKEGMREWMLKFRRFARFVN